MTSNQSDSVKPENINSNNNQNNSDNNLTTHYTFFFPTKDKIFRQNQYSNLYDKNNDEEITKLKEEINKMRTIISEKDKKIKDLENQIINANNNIEEIIKSLQEELDKKDNELKELKNKLKNTDIKKDTIIYESDMATVYFTSSDQKVNYAIPCVKKTIFAEIEEKLYKEYPEYRESNNYFIANGNQILRFKTIEENKIGNGKPVMLIIPGNNENA